MSKLYTSDRPYYRAEDNIVVICLPIVSFVGAQSKRDHRSFKSNTFYVYGT